MAAPTAAAARPATMALIMSAKSLLVVPRLAAKIKLGGDGECWIWSGATVAAGYPAASIDGKVHKLHRITYEITKGTIPAGMFVCHKCDVPRCINPEHLFVGTPLENMADMMRKGRDKHVPRPGTLNPKCKLTEAQILLIRQDCRASRMVAEDYAVSKSAIQRIRNRRYWSHLP